MTEIHCMNRQHFQRIKKYLINIIAWFEIYTFALENKIKQGMMKLFNSFYNDYKLTHWLKGVLNT